MRTIPEHVTWKNLDTGVVVLHLNTGHYYVLNQTATRIWRGVVEGEATADIVQGILQEYECGPEQARADVDEQLEYLEREGLLISSE